MRQDIQCGKRKNGQYPNYRVPVKKLGFVEKQKKERKSQLKEEDKHWCYNFFNWELNAKCNHYTFIENIWLNKVMLMFKSKGATPYESREH